MQLHDFLKRARKEKQLTLIQVAKRANISYGMLYRLEDGSIKNPNPELLKKVCAPLGIAYGSLLAQYNYISTNPATQYHVPVSQSPIVELEDIFNANPHSLGVADHTFGTATLIARCNTDAYLPFFKKEDFIGLSPTHHIQPNGVYFHQRDQHVTLSFAKQTTPAATRLYALPLCLSENTPPPTDTPLLQYLFKTRALTPT